LLAKGFLFLGPAKIGLHFYANHFHAIYNAISSAMPMVK
jgi:hypothetical protein